MELADPSRISEFLSVYVSDPSLTDDERFLLMQLIIASLEDTIAGSRDAEEAKEDKRERPPHWNEVKNLLLQDFRLHGSTIYYWSCPGDDEAESPFELSTFIREIWNQVSDELGESG